MGKWNGSRFMRWRDISEMAVTISAETMWKQILLSSIYGFIWMESWSLRQILYQVFRKTNGKRWQVSSRFRIKRARKYSKGIPGKKKWLTGCRFMTDRGSMTRPGVRHSEEIFTRPAVPMAVSTFRQMPQRWFMTIWRSGFLSLFTNNAHLGRWLQSRSLWSELRLLMWVEFLLHRLDMDSNFLFRKY